jgi:hypothetical protein
MAVQVGDAAFARHIYKLDKLELPIIRPPEAVNAAANYLITILTSQHDKTHVAALLLSKMYEILKFSANQSYDTNIKPCLAALHSCEAGTARFLWDAIYKAFAKLCNLHRTNNTTVFCTEDCLALLEASATSIRRWLLVKEYLGQLGFCIWRVVHLIVINRLCTWRQLASSFLDSNNLVVLHTSSRCVFCEEYCCQLAYMINNHCDNWSSTLCDQIAQMLSDAKTPRSVRLLDLLCVYCKFDRQIMLQHTSVLTDVLDRELLSDQRICDKRMEEIYLCCKTLHKLDVQDGEPGWQNILDQVAKIHQKCKALRHKGYCHAKIWVGKLAKQYSTNSANLCIPPNGPSKRKVDTQ